MVDVATALDDFDPLDSQDSQVGDGGALSLSSPRLLSQLKPGVVGE